jgi:TfoX/Sxy family transcriptional regulator of competence genes
MAYDEALAERLRRSLGPRPDVSEKKMFGGIAFLLDGKMVCGIVKDDLMVRVGPDRHEEALAKPHARPMDFTGRPMKGYVFVSLAGCRTDKAVKGWVDWSIDFVATLTKKTKPKKPRAFPRTARTRT